MPPTQRIQHEPAYLLHRRKYLDDSYLVDCLTATHGRVTLVARGAAKSRNAGALQIGQPLEIAWQQSGELGQLQRAEPSAPAFGIPPMVLPQVWTLHDECIRHLPRRSPVPDLFLSYAVALPQFSTAPEACLSLLEFSLLRAVGQLLLPDLIQPAQHYVWSRPEQGQGWQAQPLPQQEAPPCSHGHNMAGGLIVQLQHRQWAGAAEALQLANLRPLWAQMLSSLANASPLRTAPKPADVL